MLLKSIDIQGFKSFADKTHLQFGQGITAVVGPNGSGKSNISDAVRWVLGEQSTKSLRGASMEDVIFLGSDTRRAQGFAEVTLTIDNTDRSLHFDNDTVAVTRRYYRSHESEYLINGVSVRLRDVNELFMDTGLGRDGYSMIGQGKIDSIVGAKPNERRDIFEEASGISRYRYRKLEAERKLSAAEENMVRLNDIFGELEGRLKPLKTQSEKAERFLKLRDERKELEIGLWLHALDTSKDTLRQQEKKITAASTQYENLQNRLEEIAAEQEKTTEQNVFLNAAIDQKRHHAAELEETAVKSEGEIAVEENTILHNNQNIERLRFEIDGLKATDDSARERIEEARKLLEEKRGLLEESNQKTAEITERLNALISESEGYSKKIEDLVLKLNEITTKSAEQRVKMVSAGTAVEEITARHRLLKENREEIEAQAKEDEQELSALKSDFETLSESVTSYENALSGYQKRLLLKKQAAELALQTAQKAKMDLEDNRRRIQLLEDLERSMEGFNHAVKSVMKAKKTGELRGIHGPVVHLIDVQPQYSVAIETALGNAQQNIIVDTESDAKRSIEMLKSGKMGRATFLPVSSVKGRYIEEKKLTECYGFVGIASDLVDCKREYCEIVGALLGRTVVAEDLDSAVAIAKKFGYKYKTVSLDGAVVHTGGSMTGGSLSKQAGLLSRSGEIEALRKNAQKLESDLAAAEKEAANADEAVKAVEGNIRNTETELKTAGDDRLRVMGEVRRVEGLVQTAEQNLLSLQKQLEDCKARETGNHETIETAQKEIAALEETARALHEEMDGISGGRTALLQNRDRLSEELTAEKLRSVELQKDTETMANNVKALQNDLSDRAYRVEQLELQSDQLSAQNDEINKKIEALKNSIEELRSSAKAELQNAEQLRLERENAEKQTVDIRREERDLMETKEKLSGELARLEERKGGMMREYDDIVKKLFDEYEMTRTEAQELHIELADPAAAKRSLSEIKSKMKSLGDVNVGAIDEYKEVRERHEYYRTQLDDIEKSRRELNRMITGLTETMRDLFTDGFGKINQNFKKTFTDLFGGGSAELTLSDPENVLESGIDISVRIPGKTVSKIEPLSGGEKALVAISIYFAIMMVNPPPFCLLDEVESALDEVNVDRVAEYMHRMNASTQFICITHRRGTMESADMLYGVTMQEKGVSKLLEINISELEQKLNLK